MIPGMKGMPADNRVSANRVQRAAKPKGLKPSAPTGLQGSEARRTIVT
jgi:hypothetical protein